MDSNKHDNYGVIQFVPFAAFENPDMGLTSEEKTTRLIDKYLKKDRKPSSTSDWPRINNAIKRGELFVIEAESPEHTFQLRFDLSDISSSFYQIQSKIRGRNDIGRIDSVYPLEDIRSDSRLSMLSEFPFHIVLVSISSQRPYTKLAWRIGLRDYKVFDSIN